MMPVLSLTETRIPGLHAIELPTPFPVGTVNAYVAEGIDGEPLTLLDCGIGYEDGYQALAAGLDALGWHIRDVGRLILTHHHTDHLGLAGRIVAESGAQVIAHPYTVPFLETPIAERERGKRYMAAFFREQGTPDAVIGLLEQMEDYFTSLFTPARVTGTLDEGDTLRLAGHDWRVLHTPGHAGGQFCLFNAETGVLLSADHLLRDTSSNPLLEPPLTPGGERPRRLLDYIHHLKRIAALTPSIAYTGHGGPVEDVAGLVEKRLAHHARRAEKIHGLLGDQPHTLYELSRLTFPHVGEQDAYLTLSETIGHLDLLERNGRVRWETRADGVIEWATR